MLLRKTPLSKKLTSEEIEAKLKEVVCFCFLLIILKNEFVLFPYVSRDLDVQKQLCKV